MIAFLQRSEKVFLHPSIPVASKDPGGRKHIDFFPNNVVWTFCKRDQSYNTESSLRAQTRSQKQKLLCDDDHETD